MITCCWYFDADFAVVCPCCEAAGCFMCRVWNVTKRAIGVEVNKQVGNRIIAKRLHVRIDHLQSSRCQKDFKQRVKKNDELKAAAKARGEVISTKRQPKGPKPGFLVEGATIKTVTPIPYNVTNDLKGGY